MTKRPLRKNNGLLLCCLILFSQSIMSQTIEKLFVSMPDVLNPTMTKQNRLELIEYHKAHQRDSVANLFGNQAYLLGFDSIHQHIVVKNTESSTFDMKVLHLEDNTIVVGVIRTVCAPVCLSSVEFYDSAWTVIPMKFSIPRAIEWVDLKGIPADKVDLQWVKDLMAISFVSLKFSEDNQVIVAKNNTLDFLSDDDKKVILPYVTDKPIQLELKERLWQRKL